MAYLDDNPPAVSQFRRTRRAAVTGAIVVHTAENSTDTTLPDGGAEAVARFISRRSTPGSYHSVVDSDSVVDVGRYEWEMFHEGTGGNRWSLGLSFACQAAQWTRLPDRWVDSAIRNGALEAAMMAAWVKQTVGVTVPARRITPAQYRAGQPGFISHAELDPGRRSDPGASFPWNTFLERFAQYAGGTPPVADWCVPGNRQSVIEGSQRLLRDEGFYSGPIDADWYTGSAGALVALNNDRKQTGRERDEAFTERDQAVAARDQAIGERDAAQSSLEEANATIAANVTLIADLRTQIEELEARDPEATEKLAAARAGFLGLAEALGLKIDDADPT